MKNYFKKLSALILLVALSGSLAIGVNATNFNTHEIESDDTRYIGSCPAGDKHVMLGKGTGIAYYGPDGSTDIRIRGSASQCINCNLVLITQNNPFIDGVPWGDYATWTTDEEIPSGVVNVYTRSFSHSDSLSDPYVQGFTFRKIRELNK